MVYLPIEKHVRRPQRAAGSAEARVGQRRLAQRAHGKAHPQVVIDLVLMRGGVAHDNLLGAAGVEENVEDAVVIAARCGHAAGDRERAEARRERLAAGALVKEMQSRMASI